QRTLSRMVQGTLSTGREFSINDVFVARLNATGTQLTYGTFLGGQEGDFVDGMTVDPQGFVTLAGYVAPLVQQNPDGSLTPLVTPFPTTPDAVARAEQGSADAVVARLHLDGGGAADLKYATLLAGNDREYATGLALDPNNPQLVTVVGYTTSWNFLTTPAVLPRA